MLAESIMGIPYIESINVADNNLTDEGLGRTDDDMTLYDESSFDMMIVVSIITCDD